MFGHIPRFARALRGARVRGGGAPVRGRRAPIQWPVLVTIDEARVRADFPLLRQPIVYLDSAATSLKPQVVIEAVREVMGSSDQILEGASLDVLEVTLDAERGEPLERLLPAKEAARVTTAQGQSAVQLDDGFDRAWRRVGLTLDRTGFTVEDRDRSQGLYFVRYVEPNPDKKEPGFFGKLFSSSGNAAAPLKFRISVKSQGEATTVSVLNASGAPETSANAQRIVTVIADDLK